MIATATTFLILLSTGIAADPPPAPLGPSDSEKVEIARLIRDLAHSDFDIREAASESLAKFEGKAYRFLQTAQATNLDAETRRGKELRHETAVRHGWRIAVTELAAQVVALEVRIEGAESAHDPFLDPGGDPGLVELQFFLEVLRGAGVAVCLPWLEAMMSRAALGATAAKGPLRLAFLYVPNGMHMPDWTPNKEGVPTRKRVIIMDTTKPKIMFSRHMLL